MSVWHFLDEVGLGRAVLVRGKNPCMSEIYLPMLLPNVHAHSMALVGGKLWFTLINDSLGATNPNASTFGYINTASWAAGAPSGVYYDTLFSLGITRPNKHHSFRGIDVTASGRVALADGGEDALIVLTPK